MILGSNVLAETLSERVRELGQQAFVINTELPIDQIEKTLDALADDANATSVSHDGV